MVCLLGILDSGYRYDMTDEEAYGLGPAGHLSRDTSRRLLGWNR